MTPKPCSQYETVFSLFQAFSAVISDAARANWNTTRVAVFPTDSVIE